MSVRDKILLQLYFPQFKSPPNSRFESLFVFLNKNAPMTKKKNIPSNIIFPEKVQQGEDKRTSIIIKNIPKNIKKNVIRNLIEEFGNINFLVITKDQSIENCNIAICNVINYKSIVPIYMGLRNHSFIYMGKPYKIEIYYSKVQGKNELKNVFKNDYFGNK